MRIQHDLNRVQVGYPAWVLLYHRFQTKLSGHGQHLVLSGSVGGVGSTDEAQPQFGKQIRLLLKS